MNRLADTPAAGAPALDPDFAREVLQDLYSYRPKNRAAAWAFYALTGWAGGHRFYMGRVGTGLLMLLTGGGALVWWVVDGFLLEGMLAAHAAEQEQRRRDGRPPLALAFMPPLATDVLRRAPPWITRWNGRSRAARRLRLAGDVVVLFVAGLLLGALAGNRGGEEAVFAATAIIGITLLGGHAGRLDRLPLARGLVRWSHRLRLFYYYNRPGSPPELLVRGFTGAVLAPFRARARAEALLYLEVGAVFTLAFLALDVLDDVAAPLFEMGLVALAPGRLMGILLQEALMTFVLIYAFVTPIGAVLNLHLLTRPTHTVPRLLGLVALFAMALGLGIIG
ncbi:MAG TPA: NINE protein [Pseudomonadales bacterium]